MDEGRRMKAALKYSKINDEVYTPSYAVKPLLKYIQKFKGKTIWECCDFGGSKITEVLKSNGFNVLGSWKDECNFLTDNPSFNFDMIITNPPYSLKDDFLTRAYSIGKPFAFLLPITALEGVYRGGLYRQYGLEVIVLDKRVNFFKETKGNWFNTSWFCRDVCDKCLNFEELIYEKNDVEDLNKNNLKNSQLSLFDKEE